MHPSSLALEPLATIDLFTTSILFPFPGWHIVRVIQYVAFPDWLFHLIICIQISCVWFCGLVAYFFLLVNNFIVGYTTICLSIHLLKAILIASKFGQLLIKLLYTFVCRFLCGYKFSTHLGKCQRVQLMNYIVSVCLVL